MDELLVRTLLKEKIKIEPRYLTKSFKDEILNRLKLKVEGICSKHGYISKNSIELYKVVPGVIEIASLNGNILYDVYFYGEVCNPLIGSIIKSAKVVNLNRFGILAEVRASAKEGSILEIIIAKNSVNIVSEIDLDKIQIGDDVNIEVIGKRFNIGDRKISVIGKTIKDNVVKKEPRYKTITKIIEDDLDNLDADDTNIEEINIDGELAAVADDLDADDAREDDDADDNLDDNLDADDNLEDEDLDDDAADVAVVVGAVDNDSDDDKIGGSDFFSDHDDEYDNFEADAAGSDIGSDNES
jgi:DNA-directed RNA polymerase subunit E'/Rpb7